MTEIAFADFETRSRARLRTVQGKPGVGGRNYAAHPSTDVVCCVIREPWGDDVLYSPHARGLYVDVGGKSLPVYRDFTPPVYDAVAAHNGVDFDRHVWRRLGWPEPKRWIDTSYYARVAGMPEASLEWLAANLLHRPKDLEGSKLTQALSQPGKFYGDTLKRMSAEARAQWKATPRAKGERMPAGVLAAIKAELDRRADPRDRAPLAEEDLIRSLQYCWLDVDLLPQLWHEWLAEWEHVDHAGYEAAVIAMNDRGICFDVELARDLLEADAILAESACARAKVSKALVRSNVQFANEMARRGSPVPNCQAKTLDDLLLEPDLPDDIRTLVEARQACSSIAAGKLRAGLARVSPDGRLRDNNRIYGAHTGRDSARGVQTQNLAHGPPLDIEATIQLFMKGRLEAVHLVEA